MYLCLHPSIAPITDGETYIRLAAKYGFRGVDHRAEVWIDWVSKTSLANVLDECGAVGCRIAHASLPVYFREDDVAFESTFAQLPRRAQTIRDLGIGAMSSSVPACTRADANEFMHVLKNRLRKIHEVLEDNGLRLGIEYLGVPSLRKEGNPLIYNLEQALDLCADVGESSGLLLDSYHWHASGGDISELLDLSADQIVHVHINDAMHVPVDELNDRERLLPGAGAIDLDGFLGSIARVGYEGPVAVETFNHSLEAAGPDEAARLAARTGNDVLRRYKGPMH